MDRCRGWSTGCSSARPRGKHSATWVISEALLPHIPTVMAGPAAWDADPTISRAIEIRDGLMKNPRILEFQGRTADYPHPRG